jgi:hypothetical protein
MPRLNDSGSGVNSQDDEPWCVDLDAWLTASDEPEVDGMCLTLPEWLADQASYFASLGTQAGDFLASEICELATQARLLGAATVMTFRERRLEAMAERIGGREERS